MHALLDDADRREAKISNTADDSNPSHMQLRGAMSESDENMGKPAFRFGQR